MSRAGAGTCPAHPAGLPVDTLAHQALHDPLTDLSNRTLFMDRLSQALARSERHGSLVAVLFLDLDHFKVHQRQPGARRGKRAARQDGGAAPRRPAPRGTASRCGGDEFVILLEDIDGEGQVVDMAHR